MKSRDDRDGNLTGGAAHGSPGPGTRQHAAGQPQVVHRAIMVGNYRLDSQRGGREVADAIARAGQVERVPVRSTARAARGTGNDLRHPVVRARDLAGGSDGGVLGVLDDKRGPAAIVLRGGRHLEGSGERGIDRDRALGRTTAPFAASLEASEGKEGERELVAAMCAAMLTSWLAS